MYQLHTGSFFVFFAADGALDYLGFHFQGNILVSKLQQSKSKVQDKKSPPNDISAIVVL